MLILPPEPSRQAARSVSPGWMITFADLLSLLVAFFVLLFAATSVPSAAWQRVMQPVAGYMTGVGIHAIGVAPITAAPTVARLDLNYVGTLMTKLLAEDPGLAGARMEHQDHALVLHLPAGFDGRGARLTGLARLLGDVDNRIEIVAHSAAGRDAPAIVDWQRAVVRANAVAADLARLGVTGPLTTTGLVDVPDGGPTHLDIVLHDLAADTAPAAAPGTANAP
jgi:chemotaxis protein MotB